MKTVEPRLPHAPLGKKDDFLLERWLRAEEEVASVLVLLEQVGIDYCILAPREEGVAPGRKDVDIYVAPMRLADFETYLRQAGWQAEPNSGFRNVRRFYQNIVCGVRVQFDVSLGYYVHVRGETFAYRGTVASAKGADGFRYLPDEVALLFIVKKALETGHLSEEKVALIERISPRPAWCHGSGALLARRLQESRAEIDGRFDPVCPGGAMRGYWRKRLLNRVCLSRGRLMVAVVGLDGAGKSTITARLARQLEGDGLRHRLCYFGHSAHRLPILRWLAKASKTKTYGVVRKARSVLYLLTIPLEFLVRRGVGLYDVLIMDRHPIAEPVFPREKVSPYDRFLRAFVPRPDVVLYLTGDTQLIWNRKREHSYEEYVSMAARLERSLTQGIDASRIQRVDCSRSEDEVFAACHEIVVHLITHRPGLE